MNMITKIETPAEASADTVPRRTRWHKIAWAALPVIVIGGAWSVLQREGTAVAAMPAPTVTVAQPLVREVNEWDDYVGRFAPSKSVEVRPRVSGAITQLFFKDGDFVREGQPLFTVDPRPYRASLAEAQAEVASAQSALVLAKSDYARVAGLKGD